MIPLIVFALLVGSHTPDPETVVVRYRPLPGKAAAVAEVLAAQHDTITRLGLAAPGSCRVVWREGDAFVEVFTWKSHETPDNAPPEIRALWKRLNELVEPKDGIEIREVSPL